MAWNKDVPAAGIQARYLDDVVRTNNAALEDALSRDHEFPGTLGSTAGMHNVVQLADQAGDEAAHATAVKLWSNAGKARLIVPGGTAATVDAFPSGTIMLFGQNSAPTGWTRKTDWQDNAMLCYAAVGDIGSGGAENPQSAHTHTGPSHTHTVADHTHTVADHTHTGPSHTHTGPSHTHAPGTLTVNTRHRHTKGDNTSTGTTGLSFNPEGGCYTDYQGSTTAAVSGATAASGTGNTGASGTGNTSSNGGQTTSASGAGATGASGTAETGSNSAPYYQEVIACVKD